MINEIAVRNNQVIVVLSQSLYAEEAALLREKLVAYVEQNYVHFAIYMKDVEYIDSSGLGMLVALHKRVLAAGGEVVLHGLSGTVKDLFDFTKLNKMFKIYD